MEKKEENTDPQASTTITAYHVPVMLKETVDGLNIQPSGVYVDLTFGGGGHTKEILSRLGDGGKLFSFDQDDDAHKNHEKIINEYPAYKDRLVLVKANFRFYKKYLKLHGVAQADGVMADLGVSSHQFDEAERGFSFRFDADLDMRMNQNEGKSAQTVVNEYEEEELAKTFYLYGEIDNSRRLAQAIVRERAKNDIKTTGDLKGIASKLAKRGQENKYLAQVFQALRIEVNDEIKALEEMLLQTPEALKPGGRFVVLTYHSLEDRLVKNFIKQGKLYGEAEKDIYGNTDKPFEAISRKPVEASAEEVARNGRARSAKLRIAERN